MTRYDRLLVLGNMSEADIFICRNRNHRAMRAFTSHRQRRPHPRRQHHEPEGVGIITSPTVVVTFARRRHQHRPDMRSLSAIPTP
jgi:hypothetical protein